LALGPGLSALRRRHGLRHSCRRFRADRSRRSGSRASRQLETPAAVLVAADVVGGVDGAGGRALLLCRDRHPLHADDGARISFEEVKREVKAPLWKLAMNTPSVELQIPSIGVIAGMGAGDW
jgi:hypothetical protein